MKRISEYKKLFGVEGTIELGPLKKTYRNLIKEWHPDKFQAGDEQAIEAEQKSQQIIDAYHFLVSIAPETKEATKDEYLKVTTESGIFDFKHKGQLLEITFLDGSTYEFFGVNAGVYKKLINTDKPYRFAKRSIFNNYMYRKSKNAQQEQHA